MAILCYVSRSMCSSRQFPISFFLNDTPTTEIYTLSLHDALPIYPSSNVHKKPERQGAGKNTNKGERSCIDAGLFQCGSAKQRIARESEHRQQCQDENS